MPIVIRLGRRSHDGLTKVSVSQRRSLSYLGGWIIEAQRWVSFNCSKEPVRWSYHLCILLPARDQFVREAAGRDTFLIKGLQHLQQTNETSKLGQFFVSRPFLNSAPFVFITSILWIAICNHINSVLLVIYLHSNLPTQIWRTCSHDKTNYRRFKCSSLRSV